MRIYTINTINTEYDDNSNNRHTAPPWKSENHHHHQLYLIFSTLCHVIQYLFLAAPPHEGRKRFSTLALDAAWHWLDLHEASSIVTWPRANRRTSCCAWLVTARILYWESFFVCTIILCSSKNTWWRECYLPYDRVLTNFVFVRCTYTVRLAGYLSKFESLNTTYVPLYLSK